MAKFCNSCGSMMNDEDNVCPMCGAPVYGSDQGNYQQGGYTNDQVNYQQGGYANDQVNYQQGGYANDQQGYYQQGGYANDQQGYYQQGGYANDQQGYYQQGGYTNDQGNYQQGGYATQTSKTNISFNKNIIKIIIAAVALVVVAAVAIKVVVSFTGYRGTLRKMVNALEDEDVEELLSLSSSLGEDIFLEGYGYYYEDDYEEYCENMISETLDKYDDKVGNIKNISYEIKEVTELSDRKMENLEDYLIDYYDIDTSEVKKILKVDLRLTVKGSERTKTYNVDDREFYLIKEGSEWTIYYGNLSSYY